jgi:hypothetical protein
MKLLNFSQFVNEDNAILNTGTDSLGNVSTRDNIYTFTQQRKLKRKVKGSKYSEPMSSVTQPPMPDAASYVNRLLQ